MSANLPPLPSTRWVGLVHEGDQYDPEWTSHQDGYTEEDMHDYATAALAAQAAEVEALREALSKIAALGYGVELADSDEELIGYWSALAIRQRQAAAEALRPNAELTGPRVGHRSNE